MNITIETGRFKGSSVNITNVRLNSVGDDVLEFDMEVNAMFIDGISGEVYVKQNNLSTSDQIIVDVARALQIAINEKFQEVFGA